MMRTALLLVVVAACANNVPQDRATGPDGKVKGATPIVLEEGEAKVHGIVTYPGGDRVDWKMIELPAGKKGRLDLQMSWTTPRPGLRVAFDVFDQWNVPVINAVTNARGGRTRSATIDNARGKYFVRIFAPKRGDAGAYTMAAAFTPETPPLDPGWILKVEINGPPKLPDVPGPPSTCETHDPHDPACATVCAPGAPLTWKGCVAPPTPPTPPTPPPVVVVAPPADPIVARVLRVDITPNGLDVTVGAGSEQGITKAWKPQVLRGETMSALSGGAGSIVRVNKRTTIVRVQLTPDMMGINPNIRLAP
jgi:hypothetical protein